MIFCRKCGHYNPDGAVNCKKCTVELSADGHASFGGAAVKLAAAPKASARAVVPEPAPAVAPTPEPPAEIAGDLTPEPAAAPPPEPVVESTPEPPPAGLRSASTGNRFVLIGAAMTGIFFGGILVIAFVAGFFGPLMGTRTNQIVVVGGFLIMLVLMVATFGALRRSPGN